MCISLIASIVQGDFSTEVEKYGEKDDINACLHGRSPCGSYLLCWFTPEERYVQSDQLFA